MSFLKYPFLNRQSYTDPLARAVLISRLYTHWLFNRKPVWEQELIEIKVLPPYEVGMQEA